MSFVPSIPTNSVFVGNLECRITEDLLMELFTQGGPVTKVTIPYDKKEKKSKNFAFVQFKHPISVKYVCELFNGIVLCDRPLSVKPQNVEPKKSDYNQNGDKYEHNLSSSSVGKHSGTRNSPMKDKKRPHNYESDGRWKRGDRDEHYSSRKRKY
ncbi:hypothetical protein HZS_4671 [Henneguya salminicola]|nr:hypothetical protein HZS_4671 [Henneguya salminicola]